MIKPEIMIVDDQPSVCKEVAAFLKNDYTVVAFKSGKDSLEYLETHQVDLILLDYGMPNMTGYETLVQLRLHEATAKTPVVFLTGETNDRMRHEMLERGATDYLCKPIDAAGLRECIKKNLQVD